MNVSFSQTTHTILMVRPDHFSFNAQTAQTNVFQQKPTDEQGTRKNALLEFEAMVAVLQSAGIVVEVLSSVTNALTPDAVFPNNWFSHHQDGGKTQLVVYPLLAVNRRAERQVQAVQAILSRYNQHPEIIDISNNEDAGRILEGTGSLVLDRKNHVAYAMQSERTHEELFLQWCEFFGYEPVFFHAYDEQHRPIYHTNVALSVGSDFAVVGLDAISEESERSFVVEKLIASGKRIINVSQQQLSSFCGNILQVRSTSGAPKIVLSETAYNAYKPAQLQDLQKSGELVVVSIPTIERVGGGSARCMMAEIFVDQHPKFESE